VNEKALTLGAQRVKGGEYGEELGLAAQKDGEVGTGAVLDRWGECELYDYWQGS
jgi:hypothetical protein